MSYLDTLGNELTVVGIRGRRRRRILAEFADHLRCDPRAQLGKPSDLAREFANDLGTTLARRAAAIAFAGLAVAAALLAAGGVSARGRIFASAAIHRPIAADVGLWLTALGAQVALVAGGLAVVRTVRLRQADTISRDEAATIVRRAKVGVAAGFMTMVGFGLSALTLRSHVAGSWTSVAPGLAAGGILALLATTPTLFAAGQLRPVTSGSAGDLNEDLGPLMPLPLRTRPWSFAICVSVAVAVAITVAGVIQSDPFDGALRGLTDGTACLVGFAILGRYLKLRG